MCRLRQFVCLSIALLVACLIASPQIAHAATSVDKTDTVYVETDAAGAVRDVRVQSLLANDRHADELLDRTYLSDIEANDDQSFDEQPDGTILWSAGGQPVSYEGSSQDDLPVAIDITYTLDGKEVDASALAGASGHLVIRIDYRNDSTSLQSVGGTQESVATPFVCLSILTLDPDVASNVVVSNGSVVEDKGGLAIVGYALPGLEDSLALGELPEEIDVDLPEYVEVEADVTDLSLDGIYTIVTAEPFADLDLSDLRSDGLGDGASALEDAAGQLVSGSDALVDALWQLADGAGEVKNGAATLRQALGEAQTGVGKLAEGSKTLADGLDDAGALAGTLADGASATSQAASQATGALGEAQSGVSAASGSVSSLRGALASLDADGIGDVIADAASVAATAQDAAANAAAAAGQGSEEAADQKKAVATDIAAAQSSLESLDTLLADETLTDEQRAALEAVRSSLSSSLSSAQSDLDALVVDSSSELADASSALDRASKQLAADAERLDVASADVGDATSKADAALASLDAASDALGASSGAVAGVQQGSEGVSSGASGLAEGISAASQGATGLSQGLDALVEQTPQALAGVDALASGIDVIAQGTAATAEGAGQLRAGLVAFDEEGISQVVEALASLDQDVSGVLDKLDALRAAAKAYDTFSGKVDGQTGAVRFVYQTDGIG